MFLEKKETKSVISFKTLKVGQSKHDKIFDKRFKLLYDIRGDGINRVVFLLFNSTAKYIAAPKLAARISITKNPRIGRQVFRTFRPNGSGAGWMKAKGSSVSLDP